MHAHLQTNSLANRTVPDVHQTDIIRRSCNGVVQIKTVMKDMKKEVIALWETVQLNNILHLTSYYSLLAKPCMIGYERNVTPFKVGGTTNL